ncbi:hypothetical protein YC2023_028638 [Brassica napus]
MELALPPRFIDSITRPSSSNIFETGRLGPSERSPIRTLSEDRIHVSLRLGPLLSDTTDETEVSGELPVHPALSSKAAGKREVRKQKGHSPLQLVSMKRRCTNTRLQSPRRKLMLDAITAGGRAPRKTKPKNAVGKLIPAMVRKGKDFHPPLKPLP